MQPSIRIDGAGVLQTSPSKFRWLVVLFITTAIIVLSELKLIAANQNTQISTLDGGSQLYGFHFSINIYVYMVILGTAAARFASKVEYEKSRDSTRTKRLEGAPRAERLGS